MNKRGCAVPEMQPMWYCAGTPVDPSLDDTNWRISSALNQSADTNARDPLNPETYLAVETPAGGHASPRAAGPGTPLWRPSRGGGSRDGSPGGSLPPSRAVKIATDNLVQSRRVLLGPRTSWRDRSLPVGFRVVCCLCLRNLRKKSILFDDSEEVNRHHANTTRFCRSGPTDP